MPLPLILQIQQAVLDSNASITDALRKAKLACSKLGLVDFGNWVDLELNGYMNKTLDELPEYRKLHGTPEAYNPYHGWQPIMFPSQKSYDSWSLAPIGMSVAAIEESTRKQKNGFFEFPYLPEIASDLRKSLNRGNVNLRIKIPGPAAINILNAVRNILLEWTVEMEKQGVLGNELTFTHGEREKSASVTAQTVTNFHIGQVGALVQNAQNSVVQGGIDSTMDLRDGIRNLLDQLERELPSSDLPSETKQKTSSILAELRTESDAPIPDKSRLRAGLESLKHIMEHASGHLVAVGAHHLISNLLQNWPA